MTQKRTQANQSSDNTGTFADSPQVKIDKEFSELLPPLTPEEYETLENNIKRDKRCDPLKMWKGKEILIDGHNRHKICKKHDIQYSVEELHFDDRAAVILWIWENQIGRRSLNDFQRIIASQRFRDIIAKKAKENQKDAGGSLSPKFGKAPKEKIHTDEIIAQRTGVSPETVRKAMKIVKKHAAGVVSKEDFDAVYNNKESISSIFNKYKEPRKNKEAKVATSSTAMKNKPVDEIIIELLDHLDGLVKDIQSEQAQRKLVAEVSRWASKKKEELKK